MGVGSAGIVETVSEKRNDLPFREVEVRTRQTMPVRYRMSTTRPRRSRRIACHLAKLGPLLTTRTSKDCVSGRWSWVRRQSEAEAASSGGAASSLAASQACWTRSETGAG